MSTLGAARPPSQPARERSVLAPSTAAGLVACLAIAGIGTIWRTAEALYAMWVNDPLKSIGMLVPVASFVLILLRWRELRWEMRGSWWGLALLVADMAAVRFREQSVLVLILSPRWSIFFPPHSLVALVYVAGVVLLFGGWRLLRAAWFPVLLILLVNPVPHIFNVYVDLPLQRVSAHVARAFAIGLHQKLTPDQMRLMFTPDFGMFIAPGCNGIRGAVTMGMIALVVGYLYRFRAGAHVLFVVGAVLLGYVFNFVRLCTLVLYYIVALKIPWLQNRAEMGDYVIGACLFLLAVWLLFAVVRRVGRSEVGTAAADPAESDVLALNTMRGQRWWSAVPVRLGAMALLVLAGGARVAYGLWGTPPRPLAAAEARFPQTLGAFSLDRTWTEQMTRGPVIYQWADYAPTRKAPAAGPADTAAEESALHVAVGLSPVLGSHDTSICHSARGEDPIWHGELRTATAAGEESFNSSFFNNGATQSLEVTTVCNTESCGEYSAGTQQIGLIYSRPAPAEAFSADPQRPIPVMLRVETLDTAMPADLARRELTDAMTAFLAHVDLLTLSRAYRR